MTIESLVVAALVVYIGALLAYGPREAARILSDIL